MSLVKKAIGGTGGGGSGGGSDDPKGPKKFDPNKPPKKQTCKHCGQEFEGSHFKHAIKCKFQPHPTAEQAPPGKITDISDQKEIEDKPKAGESSGTKKNGNGGKK